MTDGRSRDDDGEQADFRWLYGSSGVPSDPEPTRVVPRQPRPDETRVMPVQPRPAPPTAPAATSATSAASATSRPVPPPVAAPVPPPPPYDAPPGRPPRTYRRGIGSWLRPRRPRFRLRYLFLLLLAWLVFLVAVPIITWERVDKVAWEPSGQRPADQPGTTYLLVGSDSRQGLTKQQRQDLSTGNAAGARTDTIMLLHTGSGPNLLLSIPRDSLVPIPGHGTTKINAAYAYGGPKLLVKTIESDTGIRIDDFVEIGMAGVAGVVDAVGGIQICPTQDMDDRLAGLHIKKGCQHADGVTALAYARSRHASTLGDIDRVKHQREVVSAVGHQVLSPWTVVLPWRWWRLNHALPDFFRFGDGTNPVRAALWATAMTRVNGNSGLTCSMPISDLAVHWDPQRSKALFAKIIADDTADLGRDLCSATGLKR